MDLPLHICYELDKELIVVNIALNQYMIIITKKKKSKIMNHVCGESVHSCIDQDWMISETYNYLHSFSNYFDILGGLINFYY